MGLICSKFNQESWENNIYNCYQKPYRKIIGMKNKYLPVEEKKGYCCACYTDNLIGFVKKECQHFMCLECLSIYLENELFNNKVIVVKCFGYNCPEKIHLIDIFTIDFLIFRNCPLLAKGMEDYYCKCFYQNINSTKPDIPKILDEEEKYCLCPNSICRLPINWSSGCEHMTCPKCKTEFCFRCKKIFSNGWIAAHPCENNFNKPKKIAQRKNSMRK